MGGRRTLAILGLLVFSQVCFAETFVVPDDFVTVQSAIDGANSGDLILVRPGIYTENLDFSGKEIHLRSLEGPTITILDGDQAGSVVQFTSGEEEGAILEGFTLRNGNAGFSGGGGIRISGGSSPVIRGNTIENCRASNGCGIAVFFSSPRIEGNTIRNNLRSGGSGGTGGGGILLQGAGSPQILDNLIEGNDMGGSASGGGLSLFAAGTPTIRRNRIVGNTSARSGGGLCLVNISDATIEDNLITENSPIGIEWLVPSGARGPVLRRNTIVNNLDAGDGASIPGGVGLGGNPRWLDGDLDGTLTVDMGAYEFNHVHLEITGDATPGGYAHPLLDGNRRSSDAGGSRSHSRRTDLLAVRHPLFQ